MNKNKGRELKYLYQRIPAQRVGILDMVNDVYKKTGFSKKHVKEVLYAYGESISERICNKEAVFIPSIGMIYPTIKPGKNVVHMHAKSDKKAELMYMPERWTCKFKVGKVLKEALLEVEVSEQELNDIYRD